MSVFDDRGDKGDFHGGEWPIGPAGAQEVYYQPAAKLHLQRFGLNVLGKFSDGDGWLTPGPFQGPENWWRVYHATNEKDLVGIAGAAGTTGAVRASTGGKLGEGVYVTPHLEYAAAFYCGTAYGALTQRQFAIVFQCAAKPGERLQSGYPGSAFFRSTELAGLFKDRYHGKDSEWTFRPEHWHVRPYGILLANASHLKDVFETEIGLRGGNIDLDF